MIMVETNNVIELDDKDKLILEILQSDAHASLRDIEEKMKEKGEKFKISTTAIRARLKHLKEKHIIKNAITLIDCRKLGYKEMIMATLTVNATHQLEDIREKLNKIEEIKYAYVVTGDSPLFIMAKCLDHDDAMKLIARLRNLPGVVEVKTQLVLDCIKEDHTIIIPKS